MALLQNSKVGFLTAEEFSIAYNMFTGVEIMMFIGFGYLMTFIKRFGIGSLGFTFLATAIGVEWCLLTESFFLNTQDESKSLVISVMDLTKALYGVAAVLISLGGVVGKIGPSQLIVLVICELAVYSFNNQVLLTSWLKVQDVGGTIIIHMFGAYFGLGLLLFFFGFPLRAHTRYRLLLQLLPWFWAIQANVSRLWTIFRTFSLLWELCFYSCIGPVLWAAHWSREAKTSSEQLSTPFWP